MTHVKRIPIYCQVRMVRWPDGIVRPELFYSETKHMSKHGVAQCFSWRDGHNEACAQWMYKHPKADKQTALVEIAAYQRYSDSLPPNKDGSQLLCIACY